MHAHLSPLVRRTLAGLALLGAAAAPCAQTVGETIRLKPGDARVRGQIARLPRLPQELRELIGGRFDWAMVDLDGDGHRELLVLSRDDGFCGSAGCTFAAYRVGPGPLRELFGGSVDGPLAMTVERYGGMRGVAVLDAQGAIQRDGQGRLHLMRLEGGDGASAQSTPIVPAAPATPAPPASPAPAGAHPDILGFRLGQSLPSEVEARLQSLKRPRTYVRSNRAELMVQTPARQRIVMPGSEHVTRMLLDGCNPGTAPCDGVTVWFAAPPGSNLAIGVDRFAYFAPVAAQALEDSLFAKWGAPSWQIRQDRAEAGGRIFAWVWNEAGHLRAPEPPSVCSKNFSAGDTPPGDAQHQAAIADEMLARGCARVIYVTYSIQNGTVKQSKLKAFDAAVAKAAISQTQSRVAEVRERELAKDRAAVSGNALPRN